MNMAYCQQGKPLRRRWNVRKGISLLEVIIATVILTVSSVMLIRIIGTADRNAQRADRRVMAQMVCQNYLDEMISGMIPLESADPEPTIHYPDWQCAVTVEPWSSGDGQTLEGLVLIEVQAFYAPVSSSTESRTIRASDTDRPAYSIRRIFRKNSEDIQKSSRFASGED